MAKRITFALALVLALAFASPALAATTAADGAGAAYGAHHAACATDTGFTATMNPGVMHQGFSGWTGM